MGRRAERLACEPPADVGASAASGVDVAAGAASGIDPVPSEPAAPSAGPGILSIVGTPIGNLSDASPRVLDTLRSADVLLCEDTRVSAKLLARFGIRVALERCDENVIASRIEAVLARVAAGQRMAFVSDAGMPGVSDPGQRLVDAALDAGLPVEVIPGPSAVTCALVASGLEMRRFFFESFLPRRAGERARRLAVLAAVPGALVFYESPHRVAATLDAIAEAFPARRVALLRELTKLHEECLRGISGELAQRVRAQGELRGECVIVVEGPSEAELAEHEAALLRSGLMAGVGVSPGAGEPSCGGTNPAESATVGPAQAGPPSLDEAVRAGLADGAPKSALAKRLARAFGISRAEAYDRIVELSNKSVD